MSAPDPRIGTILGGYEIRSLLGRGGMGVVYLANDSKLGRSVALKVLAPELSQDENFRSRFVRESQMAAATDHPNIIPVYDTGESDGVLFLAMRYVDGTDLRTVIEEQGQLDIGRAVAIVAQVGSALDAAHARNLIHRDVKPANVLLTTLGTSDEPLDHVYLTDFGLTRRSDSRSRLTATGGFMGTIDYMSPEQIEGKELDGSTDLYALGCMFYECLTGVVPYERDSDVAVMYAHMMDERPLVSATRPEVPADLDDIVVRSMSRDPGDRFDTAAAMMAATRAALGMSGSQTHHAPISVTRAGRPATEARGTHWHRRVGAVAVAGLIAVGGVAYLLTRPDAPIDTPPPTDTDTPLAWQPGPEDTLQLQLSGKLNTTYDASTYIVDLHDTPANAIEALHTAGRKVVCYISAGAWEEWRPDADSFPVGVLGENLQGSKTERWLDIRQLDTLEPILSARVAECADKGFDGVSFDNVDGYGNDSGFDLSRSDQLAFNQMLGGLAHEHGLVAGVTNAAELAQALEPDFDFALSTGCYQFDECDLFRAFTEADKPVFVIEFELDFDDVCQRAEVDGFTAQVKDYDLKAAREACWE